jgi:hypothetical protein
MHLTGPQLALAGPCTINTNGQQSVPPTERISSQAPLAKFLQDAFTQNIGITLAGLGKFDDPLSDDFVSEIASVCKPKGYASHFECNAHDPRGLGVEADAAV